MPSCFNLTIYLIFFHCEFFHDIFLHLPLCNSNTVLHWIPLVFLLKNEVCIPVLQGCLGMAWQTVWGWTQMHCVLHVLYGGINSHVFRFALCISFSDEIKCPSLVQQRWLIFLWSSALIARDVCGCFSQNFRPLQDFFLKYSPSPCAFPLSQQLWLFCSEH